MPSKPEKPRWIENEDGTGYWSDGWTGDEYGYMDDANDYPYEDGDEWLGAQNDG